MNEIAYHGCMKKGKTSKTRKLKDRIYSEMAGLTKALGNPNRLEILDLTAQGSVTVEYIAHQTGLTMANASQHLQILKNARLVEALKDGKYVYYKLAGDEVFQAWCSLRHLGFLKNLQIKSLIDEYRIDIKPEIVSNDELLERLKKNEIFLLDVRPKEEFEQGHIPSAKSIPLKTLRENLKNLPKGKQIVAYCRGPLCLMADEAVGLLRENGFDALRLENGFPDWKMADYPTEVTI